MINIRIFRNKEGNICSFEVENHGEDIVCAAVSILALNTVNSIDAFTDEEMICEYDDEGGYLKLNIPLIEANGYNRDIDLLFKSFLLGAKGIEEEYGNEVRIFDEEVQ